MIGVIADDFTGAAELAATGLRWGLTAEVVLKGRPSGHADLVCINTDSRSSVSRIARIRAGWAAKKLRELGARWIYKKVDSVLRGWVSEEVEAVMRRLRINRALIVPSNPLLGRTLRNGMYYINGVPLHRTEFGWDPQHPRMSSSVITLLTRPKLFALTVVQAKGLLPRSGIVVGEAATTKEIQHWVTRVGYKSLPGGGVDFFRQLLAFDGCRNHKALKPAKEKSFTGAAELFVCGTLSNKTRAFIEQQRSRKTPIFSLPPEMASGAGFTQAELAHFSQKVSDAFMSHFRVILNVGLEVVHDSSVATHLARCLTELASAVIRRIDIGRVFAEGGATATELAHEMRWERFQVLAELAPGIATLAPESKRSIRFTVKPGSYPWPASIQDLTRKYGACRSMQEKLMLS